MLNALFGSEARVKILNFFLLHNGDRHCLSQIARDVKLPSNSARREIDNLLKLGLVVAAPAPLAGLTSDTAELDDTPTRETDAKRSKKGKIEKDIKDNIGKKYFEINSNFILYPEIKALFVKAQILTSQKFISTLKKDFQPKLLVLTGFFTNYPEAQTDILIVGHIRRPAFMKLMAELEKELGREINFTILEEREFIYRREIMDIFLYNILDGKSVVLIDDFSSK